MEVVEVASVDAEAKAMAAEAALEDGAISVAVAATMGMVATMAGTNNIIRNSKEDSRLNRKWGRPWISSITIMDPAMAVVVGFITMAIAPARQANASRLPITTHTVMASGGDYPASLS